MLRRFRFQMSSWLSDGATPLAEDVLINHVIYAFTIYKSQSTKPGGLDVETNRDRDRERP